MNAGNWSGLVTNASPYALPHGAAVEQVNFHNAVPGQLTSRGGMRLLSHSGSRFRVQDISAVEVDGKVYVLALGEDGLHALEGPAVGSQTGQSIVPTPSSDGGVLGTTFLWQYEGLGYSAVDPTVDESPWIETLDGGRSGTQEYPFTLNANAACEGAGKLVSVYGGTSGTAIFPPSARESQLCETQ